MINRTEVEYAQHNVAVGLGLHVTPTCLLLCRPHLKPT